MLIPHSQEWKTLLKDIGKGSSTRQLSCWCISKKLGMAFGGFLP